MRHLSFKLAATLLACTVSAHAAAATVVVMIGDDDGFVGTQGNHSHPGDSFSVFSTPALAPGTYANSAGTDVTTVTPWTPYIFTFQFAWDTASLTSIDAAQVLIQSGSLGRRSDASGFGFAQVFANAGAGPISLGSLLSVSTGASASALEESVKASTFDVKSLITPSSSGVLTIKIDGTGLANPADQFAFDFAMLTITQAVPELPTLALFGIGIIGILARRKKIGL